MKTKGFKARVSIGRWHGDESNTEPVRIEIENATTGKMVVEVHMSPVRVH